jgi:hypothetical protein
VGVPGIIEASVSGGARFLNVAATASLVWSSQRLLETGTVEPFATSIGADIFGLSFDITWSAKGGCDVWQ